MPAPLLPDFKPTRTLTNPIMIKRLIPKMRGAPWLALLFFIGVSLPAMAAPIEVTNHSFEEPALNAGGWTNTLPDGAANSEWQDPEGFTAGNRFIEFIGGFFSVGNQHIGMAGGHYIFQNLGVPYEPNTTYTLTAGVGYRNPNQSGSESFTIVGLSALEGAPAADNLFTEATTNDLLGANSLFNDTHVRVDSVAINDAQIHSFTDVIVEFTTDDNPPSGNIVIVLGDDAEGARSHFDNIRLDSLTALDPDGDQIPAEWEIANGTDPDVNDGGEDPDGDTLTNFQEFELGSNPQEADTDGDGLNDNFEADTDPLNPDVDGDTLLDGEEIATHNTDPNDPDTDGDTFEDQAELAAGSDPLDPNSKPSRGGAIRVGVSFVGGNAESDGASVQGMAGVVGQSNWNNLEGAAGDPTIVTNAEGDDSLMRVSWATNGPGVAGDDPSTPDEQLMFGLLAPRGDGTGGDDVITTITVQNIAYPLYDLIVYFNADEESPAVIEAGGEVVAVDAVIPFDGNFVEVPVEGGEGNYIRFTNLSGSTLTILGRSQGISGFQIEREKPADPSLLPIPEAVDFGVFDGNPGPQEITIRVINPGETQTLNVTETTITGDQAANFSVSGVPNSLGPNNEGADVVVTFNPTDAVGIYRGFLEISSNDAVTGKTTIPLIGQIKHANGLVAHFTMDETGGEVMEDSSGNGYNGIYVGGVALDAAPLAGGGTSVGLGEGAYAEIPVDRGFPSLPEGSYSFWIQQDQADVGSASVLFSLASSAANPYAVFFQSTGGPDAITWTSEATNETLISEPFVAPGEAFHVVYTYSDRDGDQSARVALYVNGELNAEDPNASGYPLNTIAPFLIGTTPGGPFEFSGSIDDFQIYETILTPEQIVGMYNDPGSRAEAPERGVLPTPVVHYNFDEGSGTTIGNAGSGPDGTLVNAHAGAWVADGSPNGSGYLNFTQDGDSSADSQHIRTALAATDIPIFGDVDYTATVWARFDTTAPGGDSQDNMIFGQFDTENPLHLGARGGQYYMGHWGNDIGGGTVVVDEWHHVAYVYEAGVQSIYVDGEVVASEAQGPLGVEPEIIIGATRADEDRDFSGDLDDIRIYNVALTPEQIVQVMQGDDGGGAAMELLVNGSFEDPAVDNINTNNLGLAPTGWSQTGPDATWNIIRNDGSAYGSGVDNAADGSQILDLNGVFEIFQNFTLPSDATVTFGASFANREGHDGADPSTVGIYDADGTNLLSPEVSVDTSADPTPSEVWRSGEASVDLTAGEYQIRVALHNFNNVDAVFARTGGGSDPRAGATARSSGALTESTLVDFGDLAGDASYEFSFNAVKDGPSTALAGNDAWGLKLEQWNEQGVFGTTAFGVADNVFEGDNVASIFDQDAHVMIVNDTAAGETRLYVNGALGGTWAGNFELAGEVRIMGAQIDPGVDFFGVGSTMYGWATYNNALSAEEITTLANTPFGGGTGGDPGQIMQVGIGAGGGLSFTLGDGVTANIEYSTDLLNWEVIANGVSGSYEDTDAGRTGDPAGFYRAVSP